jgi:hypothetical protein
MSALTKEIRDLCATGLKDTALGKALGVNRHTARKLIEQFKLEQAQPSVTDSTQNWTPAATREEWHIRVIAQLEPLFAEKGYELPKKIRVNTGYTSGGKRAKALGEALHSSQSTEDAYHITISNRLNTAIHKGDWIKEDEDAHEEGDLTVIHTVMHECGHVALWHAGCEVHKTKPHGSTFKALMSRIGIDMYKAKGHTRFMDEGREIAKKISEAVGPYPMAPIVTETTEKKTQTTRQVKVFDPEEETYFVRMSREMITKHGLPRSPSTGLSMEIEPFSALRTKYTQEEVEANDLAHKGEDGWEVTDRGAYIAQQIITEIIEGKDVAQCDDDADDQREAA